MVELLPEEEERRTLGEAGGKRSFLFLVNSGGASGHKGKRMKVSFRLGGLASSPFSAPSCAVSLDTAGARSTGCCRARLRQSLVGRKVLKQTQLRKDHIS